MAEFLFSHKEKVYSTVSGFKGTVISRLEQLYGCNRYLVQPIVGDDGKLPEGYWHDEVELALQDMALLKKKTTFTGWKFSLGDKVKSHLTKFKGIITGRSEHMNGCLKYIVTPAGNGKNIPDEKWNDEGELVLVKGSNIPEKKEKKTGGPASSFR